MFYLGFSGNGVGWSFFVVVFDFVYLVFDLFDVFLVLS
jgi:hypothetical protein